MGENKTQASEAQLAYAQLLDWGMKIGIVILIVSFAIYVFGILSPNIPVDELPNYWEMKADEYVEVTGKDTGWGWVDDVGKGDVLNSIGIAFLALVTVVCYSRIVPIMFRDKETAMLILVLLEIGVLILAASGLDFLSSAGH